MYGLNFNAFYANKFTKLHGSALRCIIPSECGTPRNLSLTLNIFEHRFTFTKPHLVVNMLTRLR